MAETIDSVRARQILDSRGNPTLEVSVSSGLLKAKAAVPSGASTGTHEAVELRDGRKEFLGKGVLKAIENVNKAISKKLIGMECADQLGIDNLMIELDGTPDKSRLGANAILGVSMACCRLASMAEGVQLYGWIGKIYGNKKFSSPVPFANIINGGKHAGNGLAIQEFMIVPGGKAFDENTRLCSEVYQTLKKLLEKKHGKGAINVGDEGGFAPPLKATEEALDAIVDAIGELGYRKKVSLALDCAASEFFSRGKYSIDGKTMGWEALMDLYKSLARKYPIISIEDPFNEEDFDGFATALNGLGKTQIVGDDLLVTDPKRIKTAVQKKSCDCLLLKVNQIGTISEAFEAARLVMGNKWGVMVSHRSGETNDDFIADLAVGIGAQHIKLGAPCRGERVAKYNRLMEIEEILNRK